MLIFKSLYSSSSSFSKGFKYISCWYSRVNMKNIMKEAHRNLNTSHVDIQVIKFSHSLKLNIKFKYISCWYSSFLLFFQHHHILKFKYISCWYSRGENITEIGNNFAFKYISCWYSRVFERQTVSRVKI